MKPSVALDLYRDEIKEIVLANRASDPLVFGSVVHGTDTLESDLDLLVTPTTKTTLMDLARLQRSLETLLGVSVDILTPNSLSETFRTQVLKEAIPV